VQLELRRMFVKREYMYNYTKRTHGLENSRSALIPHFIDGNTFLTPCLLVFPNCLADNEEDFYSRILARKIIR
jgi:hypothetical protein